MTSITYNQKTGKIKSICVNIGGAVACGTPAKWRKNGNAKLVKACEAQVRKEMKKKR
jgi:hypothetical protein